MAKTTCMRMEVTQAEIDQTLECANRHLREPLDKQPGAKAVLFCQNLYQVASAIRRRVAVVHVDWECEALRYQASTAAPRLRHLESVSLIGSMSGLLLRQRKAPAAKAAMVLAVCVAGSAAVWHAWQLRQYQWPSSIEDYIYCEVHGAYPDEYKAAFLIRADKIAWSSIAPHSPRPYLAPVLLCSSTEAPNVQPAQTSLLKWSVYGFALSALASCIDWSRYWQ